MLTYLNLGANYLTSPVKCVFAECIENYSYYETCIFSTFAGLCKLKTLQVLVLRENQLDGNLPPCLYNLTSLRLLDLYGNNFKGAIPPILFSNLNSLEYISLSKNQFEGMFSFTFLANNSKLEVFKLQSHNNQMKCALQGVPSFLSNQHELRLLDLSENNIVAKFPSYLLANNTNLGFLSLSKNCFSDSLHFLPNSTNAHFLGLKVFANNFQVQLPPNISSMVPYLWYFNVSQNFLYGNIPHSLGDLRYLRILDLSHNKFSGQIPEYLATGCKQLTILRISYNNLQGQMWPINSSLSQLRLLYLDNNNFIGKISPGLLNIFNLALLDVSNNNLSGGIPNWIGLMKGIMSLTLSKNSLEGPVPMTFCQLKDLVFLDLSQNHFGPAIPPCNNLKLLKYLHLQGNNFKGTIPYALSNSTALVTLDVRGNKLSGHVPRWISLLTVLRILLLKGNNFHGSIPSHLCQLRNLSFLDLSQNQFSGLIPSCLSNIEFGLRIQFGKASRYFALTIGLPPNSLEDSIDLPFNLLFNLGKDEKVEFTSKTRLEVYTGTILHFMSGMDLSCNNLTGPIPSEIGYLSGIKSLNLSHNQLIRSIPASFSNLKQIESLDLSYNKLSDQIPSQLTDLNFLSIFNVSYNNLSGKIPNRKGQFDTFDQSSYQGNPLLYGEPLNKSCFKTLSTPQSPAQHEKDDSFKVMFLRSFGATYIVAFLGVVIILRYNFYYQKWLYIFIKTYIS
ncbi:Non-specific serine/threonine protein kinase, partial [Bertholletia excelsa]